MHVISCIIAFTLIGVTNAFVPSSSRVSLLGNRGFNIVTNSIVKKPLSRLYMDVTLHDVSSSAMEALTRYSPFLITYGLVMAVLNNSKNFGPGLGTPVGNMEKDNSITLKDVAGIDYVKTEIEEIISFLQEPVKYDNIGAKVPRGVLLSGPPGCGKTMLARAMSSSAGVPLIASNGAEFVSIFVGNGPKRVRELFEKARKNSPCILFIDEIDAIGGKRGSSINTNDERESSLNQLLTELDGFGRNSGVVVIGATNIPEKLDEALVRPGRMDRKIGIGLPDMKARLSILESHAIGKRMAPGVDLKTFSQQTVGFSGADLGGLLNEAAIFAVRYGSEMVEEKHIEESFDKLTIGIRMKDKDVSPGTDKIVCIHESGHALVGALQDGYHKVSRISAIPSSSGTGGFTLFRPDEDIGIHSYSGLCSELRVLLGGRAAEEVVFGPDNITTGAHGDLQRARYLASNIISEYSMGGLIAYPDSQNEELVASLLNKSYIEALELIATNVRALEAVSESLKSKRELHGVEFYDILRAYGI